jgi:hypothetical protein
MEPRGLAASRGSHADGSRYLDRSVSFVIACDRR